MSDYVTLTIEKYRLVHVSTYATVEPPRPKKKGIWYLHTSCGRKVPRGQFKTLGDRSKRQFATCVRCALRRLPKK